ncbi:hypothetical protein PIROE2DRAFT_65240, partial [Piromyces sp. E2]
SLIEVKKGNLQPSKKNLKKWLKEIPSEEKEKLREKQQPNFRFYEMLIEIYVLHILAPLEEYNSSIDFLEGEDYLTMDRKKGINLIRFPRNESEEIRETYLYLSQNKTTINFLKFKTGGEYLISIYDCEDLVIWDVNERTVHLQVKLSINVTSVDFYPDSNWLFLGSDNGCVYIYDVVNGILSTQCIICKTKSGETIPSSVQCISVNPVKNRILIGFEYGLIIQYHIKKQKVIERYQQEEILTYIKWCPDGIHFITGTSKGSLCFWKTGKTAKPLAIKNIKDYSSASTDKLNSPKDESDEKSKQSLELIKPIKDNSNHRESLYLYSEDATNNSNKVKFVRKGLKYCICVVLNENLELYINIYSIPNLDLIRVIKYPTNDLASYETLSITPTGLMIIW